MIKVKEWTLEVEWLRTVYIRIKEVVSYFVLFKLLFHTIEKKPYMENKHIYFFPGNNNCCSFRETWNLFFFGQTTRYVMGWEWGGYTVYNLFEYINFHAFHFLFLFTTLNTQNECICRHKTAIGLEFTRWINLNTYTQATHARTQCVNIYLFVYFLHKYREKV